MLAQIGQVSKNHKKAGIFDVFSKKFRSIFAPNHQNNIQECRPGTTLARPWGKALGRVNSGEHIISEQTTTVRWKKRDSLEGDSSDQMFTIHT